MERSSVITLLIALIIIAILAFLTISIVQSGGEPTMPGMTKGSGSQQEMPMDNQ